MTNPLRSKQLCFDFTMAERQGWIDDAELPTGQSVDGSTVSPQIMTALLNRLNVYLGKNDWAWPSQVSLAGDLKCSDKTIRRATEALEAMSLLITQRRRNPHGVVTLHYRIVWTELAMLEPSRRSQWRELMTAKHKSNLVPRLFDSEPAPRLEPTVPAAAPVSPRNYDDSFALTYTRKQMDTVRWQPDIQNYRPDTVPKQPDIVTDQPDTVSGKYTSNIHKETPPPQTSLATTSWAKVEEEISLLGVGMARECLAAARTAGASIDEVVCMIWKFRETCEAYPSHWKCPEYVLYRRLLNHKPGLPVNSGWIGGLLPAELANLETKSKAAEQSRRQRKSLQSKIFVAPEERSRGFSAEDRQKIKEFGRIEAAGHAESSSTFEDITVFFDNTGRRSDG